jgi:putative ABC transport system permease protein
MANTMAMTVRERTREVGMLKALGFQRGTIASLFIGEALLVTTIGALVGIGGAMILFTSIDLSLYFPNFQMFLPTAKTVLAALALSVLVGLISVAYSAYRVSGMTIADALRSTE